MLASQGLSIQTLAIIRDHLIAIAKTAGTMMKNAHPDTSKIDEKNNSADLVTATDKAIEDMISSRLAAAYPNISFLGEETFKLGTKLGDEPTFVCDPIDGTLNFTHGFPNCAVSLALVVEKNPVIGVVYNPFRDELYTAVKSHGAYLTKADGTKTRLPIRGVPAPLPSLNKSLVAVEWGNERTGPNWALRTDVAMKLMTGKADGGAMCQSIRSSGSAALDFCYVAAGTIDMFWEGGVWIWDVAAGICILREACGILVSANPNDWNPTLEGRLYFAVRGAKPAEQENVVKELWALMGDRRFKH
jgi:myo-inositol-1(or 4)-monophosphatase